MEQEAAPAAPAALAPEPEPPAVAEVPEPEPPEPEEPEDLPEPPAAVREAKALLNRAWKDRGADRLLYQESAAQQRLRDDMEACA